MRMPVKINTHGKRLMLLNISFDHASNMSHGERKKDKAHSEMRRLCPFSKVHSGIAPYI